MRQILTACEDHETDKDRWNRALLAFDLEPILARAGGLDGEHDWDTFLSLGEQQLVAFARLFLAAPQFAFLDRPTTTLNAEQVDKLLHTLTENSITYLTIGDLEELYHLHDAVLEVAADGSWRFEQLTPKLDKVSM
jgi:putative ATP-binding cassette transporter